jgi:hypothetical protein
MVFRCLSVVSYGSIPTAGVTLNRSSSMTAGHATRGSLGRSIPYLSPRVGEVRFKKRMLGNSIADLRMTKLASPAKIRTGDLLLSEQAVTMISCADYSRR